MFDAEKVRGILFDYGGTLDTRGDHWSYILADGWRKAGIDVGGAVPLQVFRDCYVFAERALARERIILPGDDFHTLLFKKIEIELTELSRLGYLESAKIPAISAIAADYCDAYARACIEEARPVLSALADRFPMVLVSNFYGNVDEVLRGYGIRQYFQGIIESAVVGIRKPDARIFLLGVIALDLPAENVLVVGDTLSKDIKPARSLGCQTAWIKGRGWKPEDDMATDPAEIPGLDTLRTLLV